MYMDSEYEDCLRRKEKDFRSLLRFAAKRYEIKGILPFEDLYQEGLIALHDTLEYHWDMDPDSDNFSRAFRYRLFHRLAKELRRYRTKSRDYKCCESLSSEDESSIPRFKNKLVDYVNTPDRSLEVSALRKYISALEDDLERASLTGSIWGNSADDGLEIFRLFKDYDGPLGDDVSYERVHRRMNNPAICRITGMDLMKVRRALRRLRKHAMTLAPQYGVDVPREKQRRKSKVSP